jgi:hypothetical protein
MDQLNPDRNEIAYASAYLSLCICPGGEDNPWPFPPGTQPFRRQRHEPLCFKSLQQLQARIPFAATRGRKPAQMLAYGVRQFTPTQRKKQIYCLLNLIDFFSCDLSTALQD